MLAWIALGFFVSRRFRSLRDPCFEQLDLGRLERLAFRWHPLGVVLVGRHAVDQWAGVEVSRRDCRLLAASDREGRRIESQSAFLLQGTVAGIAASLKNGLDLLQIVDPVVGLCRTGKNRERSHDLADSHELGFQIRCFDHNQAPIMHSSYM